jgi:hypothetical protein
MNQQDSRNGPAAAAADETGGTEKAAGSPAAGSQISLDRSVLTFGISGSLRTGPQPITISATPGLAWTAASNRPHIRLSAPSGNGTGILQVSLDPAAAPPLTSGTVTITAAGATGSPATVQINIVAATGQNPIGTVDTPANNATNVAGAIAVTGWALDDIEVTRVSVWRRSVGSEPPNTEVFIGDAPFVEGARPDVATGFPTYPMSTRGGWGLQVLTNMLPNSNGSPGTGNGTYQLFAYAHDRDNHKLLLGSRTISVNNAGATKPFGTLDTPVAGEIVTGSKAVFAWALSPQPGLIPIDGSSIWVVIDGERFIVDAQGGHPYEYNVARSDLTALFPGYQNSAGPMGVYYLNTRKLSNGIHSIAWSVTDNLSRVDGIGSRYFWTQNAEAPTTVTPTAGGGQSATVSTQFANQLQAIVRDGSNAPVSGALVRFRGPATGPSVVFPNGAASMAVVTDANGVATSPVMTANGTAGAFTVTATLFGLPEASFALTNTSGGGQITVGSVSVGRNLQRTMTVSLSAPAGPGGVPVTLTSADATRVTLGGAAQNSLVVTIGEGSSQVSVFVQGMGGGTGAVQVTASAPGYTNGTGTVTVTNSGFVLSGPNDVIGGSFTTYVGLSTPVTVSSARLNGTTFAEKQPLRTGLSGTVTVNVSSTGAGTVSVPSVTLGAGDSTAQFDFTAGNAGSATITATAPAPYTAVSGGANAVTATVLASGLTMPPSLTIGRNLQVPAAIGLNGAVPAGGITLTLTSSDPTKVRFSALPNAAGTSPLAIPIPEGARNTPNFYVQALGGTGPVTFTASAPGIGNGTTTVNIDPSGIVFTTSAGGLPNPILAAAGGSSTPVAVYSARLNTSGAWVETQEIAGGSSATVTISSNNTGVGTLSPAQVTIPGGDIGAVTSFLPGGAGETTLSVSVPGTPAGFATPAASYRQVTATVTTSRIVLAPEIISIGGNLQVEGGLVLNQPAPAGGLEVTLTSSNPTQLVLSATPAAAGAGTLKVTVPAGSTGISYYVQALGSSGTLTYTASAAGYANGTASATLTPSGVVISDSTLLPFLIIPNGTTTGTILVNMAQLNPANNKVQTLQSLRGGLSLNVTLTSANTSIATVTSPVTITGGSDPSSVSTPVQRKAIGQTTLSVTQPSGYTAATNLASDQNPMPSIQVFVQ